MLRLLCRKTQNFTGERKGAPLPDPRIHEVMIDLELRFLNEIRRKRRFFRGPFFEKETPQAPLFFQCPFFEFKKKVAHSLTRSILKKKLFHLPFKKHFRSTRIFVKGNLVIRTRFLDVSFSFFLFVTNQNVF